MGKLVKANCACGYKAKEEILVGGLRSNYRTLCCFPFLCRDCNEVFEGDLYVYRNQCPTCSGENITSYEDPCLYQASEDARKVASSDVTEWSALSPGFFPEKLTLLEKIKRWRKPVPRERSLSRDVAIMNKGHYCPKCASYGLCFNLTAMVD